MSAADDLHDAIFGFRPAKAGTAYERLAAVVLAGFGWQGVEHETTLRPDGRRAEQRLDVTATHPDGLVQRLLVECKDWNTDVGKGTLDALVGVRDQAGFDAAMAVTTKGFTSGAVDVAVDENVAMVVLREVKPDDRFVMGFTLELTPWGHDWTDVQLLVDPDIDVRNGPAGQISIDEHLLYPDGAPAETLAEIFQSQSISWEEGTFKHEIRFDEGRLVPMESGQPVRIIGIKWTETARKSSPVRSSSMEESKPCLVVEQLNGQGESERARLVVDRHLNAWDIAEDGTVVERGRLT